MTTRILRLAFLMFLLGVAFSAGCVLSQRDAQRPRRVGSDALHLNTPDLETIIAGMKHHDSLVTSATGDFVIERYKHGGSEFEKIEYALTFEGEKVQIQVDWGWGPSFEEKIFSLGEEVAGETHRRVHRAHLVCFSDRRDLRCRTALGDICPERTTPKR